MDSDATRARLADELTNDPTLSMEELVAKLGVSRQRIYVLLREAGLKAGKSKRIRPRRPPAPPPTPRLAIDGVIGTISSSAAGAVSEVIAAADLLARGWHVFFPLVRSRRCDLIALSPDGLQTRRIEVRSGKRVGGGLLYNKKPTDTCDHYAIVLINEPVLFLPEIESHK